MPLDDNDRSKILELAAMGVPQTAIADQFKISPQYVSQILAKNADDLAEIRSNPQVRRAGAPRMQQEGRSRKKAARVQDKKPPSGTPRPSGSPAAPPPAPKMAEPSTKPAEPRRRTTTA